MKICVMGAGVVGVSTAYMLARQGHEVIVIDKAERAASGTSKANGAQLSYTYVDPFAAPETLKSLPKYLLGLDPGIKLGMSLKPSYINWGLQFLANCRRSQHSKNLTSHLELASRSRKVLEEISPDIPKNAMEGTGQGKIILARSQKQLKESARYSAEKNAFGFEMRALNKDECLAKEPSLRFWADEFCGGLFSPEDRALDTLSFTDTLQNASTGNCKPIYHFGETITKIAMSDGQVKAIETDKTVHKCDLAIACLGNETNPILKDFGVNLPIYPMQGYSLTLPATEHAPKCSITDLKHKIVFANLGDKVRIAGFLDTNLSKEKSGKRGQELLDLSRRLWPEIADYEGELEVWTGQRPMMPSGVPVVGESKTKGLYINAGHGSFGYTFALGCADMIAEAVGPA